MPKIPTFIVHLAQDWDTDTGDIARYLWVQHRAFHDLVSPVTDFTGWLMLKLSCTAREANTAIRWMQRHPEQKG